MNKPLDDFDDMPEMTEEMLTELKSSGDLHLGAAEVKPLRKDWWAKKYGPKKPGPAILAIDAFIILMALIVLDLIIMSWIYVFN
jgi:hypothetical protein